MGGGGERADVVGSTCQVSVGFFVVVVGNFLVMI